MGKMLIINEGDIQNLEFEEILVEYRALIINEINRFHNLRMDFDDKYQIASIALWNAYMNFDISKNVGFGVLAEIAIENKLKGAIHYNRRAIRNPKINGIRVISIDDMLPGKHNDDRPVLDMVESEEDIVGDFVVKSMKHIFVEKLTLKQKEIIFLYMRGNSYKDICKILDVKQSTISMRMTAAKRIFKKCMAV